MRLVSINVGLPREVVYKGNRVTTGIFKEPVEGRLQLRKLNLDGDRQADLAVHGGPDKAVYAYPVEHYAYWRNELPDMNLPFGMFGENFTVEGLFEDQVHIGDQLQIGPAKLVVTQPRLPCYKLAVKFGRDDIIELFLASHRTGFYLRVLEEGDVGAGDRVDMIHRGDKNVAVADITRLYVGDKHDIETMQRAIEVEALPEDWRDYFRHKIEKVDGRRQR